jgi:glycosyltransferase involved in cell wall biosynthesis
MLFLTARLPATDVDAAIYETRAIEGLQATPHTFDVADDGKNAERYQQIVDLLAAQPSGAPVVISSTVLPLVGGALRAESRRLRAVVICHRTTGRDPRFAHIDAKALDAIDAQTLQYARRVVVPSIHTAMSIGAFSVLPDQLAVITPGADRAPLAESPGAFHCVMHAPVDRNSGHDQVIETIASIPHATLDIVVTASNPSYLADMRAKADAITRITWSTDPKSALHKADLAVLAYKYDPHGLGILEALARGLPVVTTNAGAAANLVPKDAGVLHGPEALHRITPKLLALMQQGAQRARDEVRSWSRVSAELSREIGIACR